MPLPANIKDISADVLPAEVFLYPVCTTREGFSAMLEAMDNYYLKQRERVDIIKDFLNAQEFVGNPLDQPCLKELVDDLLANQPPQVKYVLVENEEFEECDEMANCNCSAGAMRFCDGKVQYKKDDGTWADLPSTALPNDNLPVDDPALPATQDNACWKAIGIWNAFAQVVDALIVVMGSGGNFTPTMYAAFQNQFPAIKADNANLYETIRNNQALDPAIPSLWASQRDDLEKAYTCHFANVLAKNQTLSDDEIDLIRDYDWDTGESNFDTLLGDADDIAESVWLKQEAFNAVRSAQGSCNCGAGAIIPPSDGEDWTQTFDFETLASFAGWAAWTDPITAYTHQVTSESPGLVAGDNIIPGGFVARREVNIFIPLNPDSTSRLKTLTFYPTGVVEAAQGNVPSQKRIASVRVKLGALAEGDNVTALMSSPTTIGFGIGSGSRVFGFNDQVAIPPSSAMQFVLNVAQRNDSDQDIDGAGVVAQIVVTGSGTNPFI